MLDDIGPIWNELQGRLWHTTHPRRFIGILESGAILPEPPIAEADRWGTSQGPRHYPYARHIGALSLFDFESFDPDFYQREYPASSWREFVPMRRVWGGAVWIEIDRSKLSGFVSGPDLIRRRKDGGELGHNLFPLIEAAHIGPLPLTAAARVLAIRQLDPETYYEAPFREFNRARYEVWLGGWREPDPALLFPSRAIRPST